MDHVIVLIFRKINNANEIYSTIEFGPIRNKFSDNFTIKTSLGYNRFRFEKPGVYLYDFVNSKLTNILPDLSINISLMLGSDIIRDNTKSVFYNNKSKQYFIHSFDINGYKGDIKISENEYNEFGKTIIKANSLNTVDLSSLHKIQIIN